MPIRFILTACLMLILLAPTGAGADQTKNYMRTMALVNWAYIIPAEPLSEENLPSLFKARVRRSGKLMSLGLPVRVGDQVLVEQSGPYVWSISKGRDSININTYDIPAEFYPRFR